MKNKKSALHIEHILLDIGVVLLNLNYGAAIEQIRPFCDTKNAENISTFLNLHERDPVIAMYERGQIDVQAFFRHFVEITGFHGAFDQFKAIWCNIFSENRAMIEFARSLARRFDVYFLTNAGDLHIPLVYNLFPSLKFFKDDAASCYLGALKPDRAFFEKALAKFGIGPETCLFVDDRPENVEGAKKFGIDSILYTTPEETIAAMKAKLRLNRTINPKKG